MEKLDWREIGQAAENDSKFIITRTMKLYGACRNVIHTLETNNKKSYMSN